MHLSRWRLWWISGVNTSLVEVARLGRARDRMPLDLSANLRWFGSAMKLSQLVDNPGVRLGDPLGLPHIVQPCGRIVALGPELWFGEVAQQVPVTCSIAPADPPALCHQGEELLHVLLADPVFDCDHDRAAAVLDLHAEAGLLPAVERFQI